MFESVAPETFVPRSRKLFYESLPMSLLAHGAVAVAIVILGTWEVTFPKDSPRLSVMYSLELPPTPPPAPPSPAQAQAAPKPVEQQRPIDPKEIVAPTFIPDEIPVVEPIAPVEHSVGEGTVGESIVKGWTGGATGEGRGGGETGDGVEGGIEGGVGDLLPPNTIFVKRHQPLPTSMTPMSMVYPFYPEEARLRGWEDAVTVRYIIGKDGRVKSVEVLEAPERELFQKIVVKAIRHWRFRPLIKEGIPQEVIHELVVYFKLNAS